VKKVSKNFVYHFRALLARSVTFSNFRIGDSQISVAHCACPSEYVAHKMLLSNKTQECFFILFKTPFITIIDQYQPMHFTFNNILV